MHHTNTAALLRRTARDRRGFTLVELSVVTAIIGILAVLALPRFFNYVSALRSSGAASQVTADITRARMTAVREGRTTSLTVNGTTGYTLAVENTDGSVNRTLRSVSLTSSYPGISITSSGGKISFDSRGLLKSGTGTVTLKRGGRTQTLTINAVGRVRRESAQ
jgi:prepilin-type N-terminal cleavage/methylation domain-containing protein